MIDALSELGTQLEDPGLHASYGMVPVPLTRWFVAGVAADAGSPIRSLCGLSV